ncbi:MAG: transglycosylase SLT domain-containing protein [Firmicutes bacterium]|nr:transglycosylase SLT domain-containing protein [Bacillota bacterium]
MRFISILKHIGRAILSLIAIAVCSVLFSAAALVPYRESETEDPEKLLKAEAVFMMKDIYIDGRHVFNWALEDPVVKIMDQYYVPLSILQTVEPEEDGTAYAGHLEDGAIVISQEEKAVPQAQEDPAEPDATSAADESPADAPEDNAPDAVSAPAGQAVLAELPSAPAEEPSAAEQILAASAFADLLGSSEAEEDLSFVSLNIDPDSRYVGHDFYIRFSGTYGYKDLEGVLLHDSRDIFISESGCVYGSEDLLRNSLGIDVYSTEVGGLYLSTDPEISARRWAESNTNESYITGVAQYMRIINRRIPEQTAQYYEYLIRHVAGQHRALDPNIIFAMIWTESTFKADAGTNALGLMQALPKYAIRRGYTERMLLDPHHNLEYGTYYLETMLKTFNGDLISAIAAYNMGAGGVKSRDNPRTSYVDVVLGRAAQLESWLASKGYGTHFNYQITLKEPNGI